jgi:hypothetical protein
MVGPPSSQVLHLEDWYGRSEARHPHKMNSSPDLPDSSTLPESLRLLPLLWSLNTALARTSLEMDAKLGVTGPQRFLVRFVGLEPGISRARLEGVISLDGSDLQAALDQLVDKNLLTEQAGSAGTTSPQKGPPLTQS